jgi:hypothetical protein
MIECAFTSRLGRDAKRRMARNGELPAQNAADRLTGTQAHSAAAALAGAADTRAA